MNDPDEVLAKLEAGEPLRPGDLDAFTPARAIAELARQAEALGLYHNDDPVVCAEHLRFVPCRPCLYRSELPPERWPWTADPVIVAAVRAHQHRHHDED